MSKQEFPTERSVSVRHIKRTEHDLHIYLSDLIPATGQYSYDPDSEVNVVIHFLDEGGRDRSKKVSFLNTTII
jgi:hypothetical protein